MPDDFIRNMLDLHTEYDALSEAERRHVDLCGAIVRAEMRRIAEEIDAETVAGSPPPQQHSAR